MSLVEPPVVTVQFIKSDYTVDEGNSVRVEAAVELRPKEHHHHPHHDNGPG